MTDQAWEHYNEATRQAWCGHWPEDNPLQLAVAQVEAILAVAGALLGKPAVVVTEGHGCPECGAVVDHSWMSDEAREEYHDRLHVVDAPVEEELA